MLPDTIPDPLRLLEQDLDRARELGDPTAGVGCLATVDAEAKPHARIVTFRIVDGAHLQFWASHTSPKVRQLEAGSRYELNVWWPSVLRQYRMQGQAEWLPAERMRGEYAGRPWRAKVWDLLREELPQSGVLDDRAELVDRFEALARELEQRFGNLADLPPPIDAGAVRLLVRRVEVEHIDLERRLHDRRSLVREGDRWSPVLLVP